RVPLFPTRHLLARQLYDTHVRHPPLASGINMNPYECAMPWQRSVNSVSLYLSLFLSLSLSLSLFLPLLFLSLALPLFTLLLSICLSSLSLALDLPLFTLSLSRSASLHSLSLSLSLSSPFFITSSLSACSYLTKADLKIRC